MDFQTVKNRPVAPRPVSLFLCVCYQLLLILANCAPACLTCPPAKSHLCTSLALPQHHHHHRRRQHHHCHFYHHLFWTQHICHKWIYPRVKCLIWNTSQLQKDALFQCFAQYVLLLHTDDRHRRGSQYLAVPPFPLIFAQDALTTSYATLAFWDLSNLRNYTCDAFWDFSNSFFSPIQYLYFLF